MLEIFKLILAYDKPKKSRKCVPDTLYKIKIEKAVTQNLGKKEKMHAHKNKFKSPAHCNTGIIKEKNVLHLPLLFLLPLLLLFLIIVS